MLNRRIAGAIAVAALASTFAASATGGRDISSFVIQGDYKIGGYAVKADGSFGGAIEEFGDPSIVRRDGRYREFCYASWTGLGVRLTL